MNFLYRKSIVGTRQHGTIIMTCHHEANDFKAHCPVIHSSREVAINCKTSFQFCRNRQSCWIFRDFVFCRLPADQLFFDDLRALLSVALLYDHRLTVEESIDLVNLFCTFSIKFMSFLKWDDHMTKANSSLGGT